MIDSGQSGQPQHHQSPKKDRRGRLAELGPAWITAIASLIVALTGAGFFVGRASVTSNPPVSPTATPKTAPVASSGGSGTSAPPASPSDTASQTTAGVQLGTYSFGLTNGYDAPLGPTAPKQSQIMPANVGGSYDIGFNSSVYAGSNEKMIGLPQGSTPTYSACSTGTVFETAASPLAQGTSFCIEETSGDIAGVTITSVGGSPLYTAFKVILWR
jgi:hypothetical protein